jgi:hypothetical protein
VSFPKEPVMIQTHDKCKYFESKTHCPSFYEKRMQQYFDMFPTFDGHNPRTLIKDNGIPDIDKEFCNNCDSFKKL